MAANGERRPANTRQSCRRHGRKFILEQVGGPPCTPFKSQYRELKTYSTVLLTGGGLKVPIFSADTGVMWHSVSTRDRPDRRKSQQTQIPATEKGKRRIKRRIKRKAARTQKHDQLEFLQSEKTKLVRKKSHDEKRATRVALRVKNKIL